MTDTLAGEKVSRSDLLYLVDAVAASRNVDKEDVYQAIEQAVQKAGRERYGSELNVRATVDRQTGEISLHHVLLVYDADEPWPPSWSLPAADLAASSEDGTDQSDANEGMGDDKEEESTFQQSDSPPKAAPNPWSNLRRPDHTKRSSFVPEEGDLTNEISKANVIPLSEARATSPDIQVGDVFLNPLPMIDFGRVGAQIGKQVVFHKIRDAERERQYEEYKDRIGQVVSGVVKRTEMNGNVILDLGHAEGLIRQRHTILREDMRRGVRVRAYITDVRNDSHDAQIFLSRTDPRFLVELFRREVPEIYDGVVEIRAVARDPGSRSKIGVHSNDSSIDPVGACVGVRGVRVQSVAQELRGEKIDIVPWSPDIATFVVNSLSPAEISKVIVEEDERRVEVVAEDTQLSLAIGRRGQNVRLASILTGCHIEVLTIAQHAERQQAEFEQATKTFMEALDVDELISQVLVMEGFLSLDDIAEANDGELRTINGLTEEIARELRRRAVAHLEKTKAEAITKLEALGARKDLLETEGLKHPMLTTLVEAGIKTLEDFAGLTNEDLIDRNDGLLREHGVRRDWANVTIMKARHRLGWVGEEDVRAAEEEVAARAARRVQANTLTSVSPQSASKSAGPINPFAPVASSTAGNEASAPSDPPTDSSVPT